MGWSGREWKRLERNTGEWKEVRMSDIYFKEWKIVEIHSLTHEKNRTGLDLSLKRVES